MYLIEPQGRHAGGLHVRTPRAPLQEPPGQELLVEVGHIRGTAEARDDGAHGPHALPPAELTRAAPTPGQRGVGVQQRVGRLCEEPREAQRLPAAEAAPGGVRRVQEEASEGSAD